MEGQLNGHSARTWSPSSWRSKPIKQDVTYTDQAGLRSAVATLSRLPPLVTPSEILKLRSLLHEVAEGKAFLLQGGDCAELFDYCQKDMIEAKIKLLLQMSLILIWASKKKVVRVARMAGQFAKPRSSPTETVNGIDMPSFRGDNINGFEATPESRKPDPRRLVDAYFHSAATLNYLRSAISSGIADLHSPLDWSLGHVLDPALKDRYQRIVQSLIDTLDFMRATGSGSGQDLETVDLFTSHEGLLLDYEEALTREASSPADNLSHSGSGLDSGPSDSMHPSIAFYNTSAHFIWIGDRTRQLTHAHVEFFRGLANPIGIKVGPSMPASDLPPLLDILNPNLVPGKVTLITRYGADKIAQCLPEHIKAIQGTKHRNAVIWQCDPMHGNTKSASASTLSHSATGSSSSSSSSPIKTRHFTDILSEVRQALEIHRAHCSFLGGVHLELTGEAVTECVGGASGLTEEDLSLNYTTFCDPRLNEKQALELAFLVAGFYREGRGDAMER